MGTTNLMVFILIAIGLFFLVMAIVQLLKAKKAEKTWPTATGTVTSSKVGTHLARSSRGGTTTKFMPEVDYEYQVNEITYRGSAVGFGKATMSSKKSRQVVERYPQGSAVSVRYDPQDPAKAVLEPKALGFGNNLALAIIIVVMGIVLFFLLN